MTDPVRIPADVDREDRILASLTARQVCVLAATGLVLYLGWTATRTLLPVVAYLLLATPVGLGVAALVVLQRDGLILDRLLLAAVRQRLAPRRRIAAGTPQPVPEWLSATATGTNDVTVGGLDLPARGIDGAGIVDLGRDGVAIIAVCSTVNFALRTAAEQQAVVAAFSRYLHSLSAPIQILIRTARLDLSNQIADVRRRAASLPHPALEQAAHDHGRYLAQLAEHTDLLRRQVLLVLREPLRAPAPTSMSGPMSLRRRSSTAGTDTGPALRRAATQRLVRRLHDAIDLLAPAGITVTVLDSGQATSVLSAACDPDRLVPPSAAIAGPDEVITTAEAARDRDLSGVTTRS